MRLSFRTAFLTAALIGASFRFGADDVGVTPAPANKNDAPKKADVTVTAQAPQVKKAQIKKAAAVKQVAAPVVAVTIDSVRQAPVAADSMAVTNTAILMDDFTEFALAKDKLDSLLNADAVDLLSVTNPDSLARVLCVCTPQRMAAGDTLSLCVDGMGSFIKTVQQSDEDRSKPDSTLNGRDIFVMSDIAFKDASIDIVTDITNARDKLRSVTVTYETDAAALAAELCQTAACVDALTQDIDELKVMAEDNSDSLNVKKKKRGYDDSKKKKRGFLRRLNRN